MADKEKELEMEDTGGKKKKMIIIIAAVVVLVAGGAGAFLFFGGGSSDTNAEISSSLDDDGSGDADDDAKGDANTASMGTALYVPMPRPFRFNIPGAARDRLVEIKVQLLVRGADNEETAKKHVPLVESTLLQVFSQSNADDLATSAGKESLKQKSLTEVQKVFREIESDKIVEKVLFTGFVMQ